MNKLVAVGLGLGASVVFVAGVTYGWASWAAHARLATTYDLHVHDLDVPAPGTPEHDAAVARGEHLMNARYACTVCHGADLGGGVMIDAFPIGEIKGPNLTSGPGTAVADYTMADWDRMIRHGVKPDGSSSVMPSVDFFGMSDQELVDLVTYIQSVPPVDRTQPPVSFGPVGLMLMATGQMYVSAELTDHSLVHPKAPPEAAPTPTFGKHLMGVCTGCHGANLAGGPIPGGDPAWPPAANLTHGPEGIGDWTYGTFVQAMTQGTKPDGSALKAPMTDIAPYAKNMTETELQAMWAYLQTVPAVP